MGNDEFIDLYLLVASGYNKVQSVWPGLDVYCQAGAASLAVQQGVASYISNGNLGAGGRVKACYGELALPDGYRVQGQLAGQAVGGGRYPLNTGCV